MIHVSDRRQENSHHHGERQAPLSGTILRMLGEPTGKNRDKNDVVDAEHDLERRQRKQCNPNLRIQEPFHGSPFVAGLKNVERRTRRFSEPGDPRSFQSHGRSASRFAYIAQYYRNDLI
jgi:hypothetical protein